MFVERIGGKCVAERFRYPLAKLGRRSAGEGHDKHPRQIGGVVSGGKRADYPCRQCCCFAGTRGSGKEYAFVSCFNGVSLRRSHIEAQVATSFNRVFSAHCGI